MSIRFFGSLSLASFAVATVGSDVTARTTIGQQSFANAVSEHLYYAAIPPFGTFMLFAPFFCLALISARISDKTNRAMGLTIFGVFATVLTYLYFRGYQGSQYALLEEKWTAAALSVGFLPFVAIPVLLIALVVGVAVTKATR